MVEAQGRGALHYHLLFWGSYSPHVLQHAATMPEFKERLEKALNTQTVAELPRDLHVARLRARGLRAQHMPATEPPPVRVSRVPLVALDPASILKRAQQCASATCVRACIRASVLILHSQCRFTRTPLRVTKAHRESAVAECASPTGL